MYIHERERKRERERERERAIVESYNFYDLKKKIVC
jgi:hypothetical protein